MSDNVEVSHVMSLKDFERLYGNAEDVPDAWNQPDNPSCDWDYGLPMGHRGVVVYG